MRGFRTFVLLVSAAAVPSCTAAQSAGVQATPLFGPVIGREPILGRADADGRVLLLVRAAGLVSIDLERREARTTALPADALTTCWGLARRADGTLWTLKDRHTLARLGENGSVEEEHVLDDPHLGLVAIDGQLVYQRVAGSGTVAYETGPPGQESRRPWTLMAPRAFAMSGAAALPLNLFTCGESASEERPCWFPDETALTLVGGENAARRIALEELVHVPAEVLVTSDNPARPIRSAYVAADRTIWILGSGSPPPGSTPSGAWLLGHYRADGTKLLLAPLQLAARAILGVANGSVVLLASDGRVVEVRP